MGWLYYMATCYKNGKIDRKAECDKAMTDSHNTVLKSTMVGSTYYAAIHYKDENKELVYGMVCLTHTSGWDFGFKDMDESMGPYYYDCPKSIIKLLSPTDNERALEWRKICLNKKETTTKKLSKLPIGAKIKFNDTVYVKHEAAYQFKRPFWYNPLKHQYVSIKYIPDNYELLPQ